MNLDTFLNILYVERWDKSRLFYKTFNDPFQEADLELRKDRQTPMSDTGFYKFMADSGRIIDGSPDDIINKALTQ